MSILLIRHVQRIGLYVCKRERAREIEREKEADRERKKERDRERRKECKLGLPDLLPSLRYVL